VRRRITRHDIGGWVKRKEINWKDQDVGGWIILKWISEIEGVVWIILIWLRLGTGRGHL
jgi:hypothetical protein